MSLRSKSFLKLIGTYLVLTAALASLFYFFPYMVLSEIQETSLLIREARARVLFLELATAEAELNEKRLERETASLEKIDAAFLEVGNPLPFIESIEALGKSTSVDLSIDLLGENQHSFRFTVIGKAEDAFTFLRKIENAPIILTVSDVVIDRLTGDEVASVTAVRKVSSVPEIRMVITAEALAL